MAKVLAKLGNIKEAAELFGEAKKILKEVKTEKKERKDIPVHCSLAACFGELTKETAKAMDAELQVMIAGTTRDLSKVKNKSWKNVQSCMMQNVLIEPVSGSSVTRSDRFTKDGTNYFKFDGSPDKSVVNEVKSWFTKLISDSDVLKDTKIDIDFLANVVAATGASIDSFVTFFFKKVYYEKTIVDVGILRYPDIEHPYFKLYRIELKAWSDCSRVLFVQKDKNGINGQYNSMKFKPRKSIMDRISKKIFDQSQKEVEDLFKD